MTTKKLASTLILALVAIFLLASAAAAQLPALHYIDFNDGAGTTPTDRAAPGLPGGVPTLVGGASFGPSFPFAVGSSLATDPANPGFLRTNAPFTLSGDWTIECWFRDDFPAGDNTLAYLLGDPTAAQFRVFRGGSAGPDKLLVRGAGFPDILVHFGSSPGPWRHLTIIYREALQEIFALIDGVIIQFSPTFGSLTIPAPNGITVGSYGSSSSCWNGLIDEFRVWDLNRGPVMDTFRHGEIRLVDEFPYYETFDDRPLAPLQSFSSVAPTGWMHAELPTFQQPGWAFRADPTPTPTTGPPADHTTGVAGDGFYAYIEDSSTPEPSLVIATPQLDVSGLADPRLSFWVWSDAADTEPIANRLELDVFSYRSSQERREFFDDILPGFGLRDLGPGWNLIEVELTPYVFADTLWVQIRFDAANDLSGTGHDIAIDDVLIHDAAAPAGQTPRPGLAELQINETETLNGIPFSFHLGGPYRATAPIGEPLVMKIAGEPYQPIVLFSGPLDPGVVVFPGAVGQSDVGGPIDPATGEQTMVDIVADGTRGGLWNGFFNTGPTGEAVLTFPTPALPPGVLTSLQAVVFSSAPPLVALSNAVELTIE